ACGDNQTFFTEEKETGYCDMPCSGNTSEMCGGDNDYDMFELIEGVVMPDETTPSPVASTPSPVAPTSSPVAVSPTAEPTLFEYKSCKDGVDGIQSESCDVCCPAACGVCGGDTCASPADDSLGADECCES
ncbi:unnamed protein product, partial [Scytosiphon promiscuus]